MKIIQSYLNKRGIIGPWEINPLPRKKFQQTIVIPSFGEADLLPNTLDSLNNNNALILENTLVVLVVNNSQNSPQCIVKNNQYTLNTLTSEQFDFTLGVVDASSSGFALSAKHAGVGLARKIGMDLALRHLSAPENLIFCTDADTVVRKDYIELVKTYFDTTGAQAAVVGFRHLESDDTERDRIIRKYENYLFSTAINIRNAGSPYGYVAMGSTIVCTAKAYCAVGGMSRKKATEDFYFLQELTKFCGVHTIPEILVYPSSRPISRVYLGTGFRIKQAQEGFELKTLYYSDTAFQILKEFIDLGSNAWGIELSLLKKNTSAIHPHLMDFLFQEGIKDVWANLQRNAPSKTHFNKQFHRWFDGLKTIRLLKYFTKTA